MLVQEKINEDGAVKTNFTLKLETPELYISLEDSCFLYEEKMQIFFQVTDAEVSPDLSDFSFEVQKLMDIYKSIFYVEDICLETQEEHRSDLFEDVSLVKGQISSDLRTFPLLEVDETSLGINSYKSEDRHVIFESNELQQLMHKDELTCDLTELLLSTEFDLLELILNHPSLECHTCEVLCVNFAPQDIINTIENPFSPLAFEQQEFFDINTSHFSQVCFDSEVTSEVEHCEEMFGDTTLYTFNDLIVTHELILRDDSFKSLPVPIISDHAKIFSVQTIVEEILLKLKLEPSSTSDDIYLDWHILDEDISSHKLCTFLKVFEDIETYCINTDVNSCDSQMLILEFVLSDAYSNEQKTEEKTEVLNIERCGILKEPVRHDEIASSEICKKMTSGESLVNNKVNKAHQIVESMTQFDDLDFFLNPLEAICVKKQKTADKNLEMNCALLVDSANILIRKHDTSQKEHSLENGFHPRGEFHSTSVLSESRKNSDGPLHSRSIEETTYEVPKLLLATESNIINTNMTSFPAAIIIVNTQNVETEMIFEGDVGFLGSIMESSDELYAAAASLGIDLQLFVHIHLTSLMR
ncbi:hypothetical protein L1987_76032 [Smallanthus sonchifolius]|uniref:Uncharacterized protein n=1 Tax=Smallanthus sonchifolius TaxID=185202 RepID=A0ACB9ABI0_9ASTR|nr:hypothetical protein L1987_76032 [Smallanthus sonchifolius]